MPLPLPRLAKDAASRVADEAYFVAACARSGLLAPQPPVRLARMAVGLVTRGSLSGLLQAVTLRYADTTAVLDELGAITYADLDRNANAIANGWLDRGFEPGEGIAILCRNHRHFLEAFFAATKCGARIVLLNTDFSGPQLRDVAEREGTDLLVHDDEYAELLTGVDPPHGRWRAWIDRPGPGHPGGAGEGGLDEHATATGGGGPVHGADQRHHRNAQGSLPRCPEGRLAGGDRRTARRGCRSTPARRCRSARRCSTRWVWR